jgi:MYXO-CTERM domain-containing protein
VNGANGIAGATFSGGFGANGNKTYSPKIASDTFTSTLTVTSGVIQSVTSTVNVVPAPPSSKVPGPLPLLGAGAAFGFSRRLRQRVKFAV